jgi:dolichol-phosphate mannosyltransferase
MPEDATLDLTIVVPTYKEVGNLEPLTQRIFEATTAAKITAEVLVVDDDSQDGTEVKCGELAEKYNIRLITRKQERGLASAVLHGLAHAQGRYLLCMDADLSHPPEAIPAMVQALANGADFVLGSRYGAGGMVQQGWGPHRWLASKLATALAAPLTTVSDPMSGFFALSRERFAASPRLAPLGYKICLELLVKLRPRRIVEIPIVFEDRKIGKSKLSLRVQIEYLRHLRLLYRYKYPLLVEIGHFLLVGGLGFLVDVAVYAGSQFVFGLNHLLARGLAFVCAATHNWLLNRHYTFVSGRRDPLLSQWASYLYVVLFGFVVSVGTYAILTTRAPFSDHRYLALIIGTLAGTAFNFIAARMYVFSRWPVRDPR